ncbi:DEAD/DEAH box helicase [Sphingomonas sabuli]|uniref:DEAD/DEAH box helicase n=1 Tax=Sphingomonas sabuli TaxID=2764186 RepID=A0A7G9L196_9SPHN|nr:DEAD/DEAH box helicase [Sphingomonas sabuli]QNM82395.1 DEAD/DEAH box helicase [Sphingomonas sabuli]
MTTALMDHQKEGVTFLTNGRAGLLAFEQGLGKTLVAIDAFRRLREAGEAERMLVICPNSLKRNWVAEIGKFAPGLTVELAEGTPKTRRQTFSASTAHVLVTSYETARTEVTSVLAFTTVNRVVLVLDESHTAKNWRSLTSTAMRHFAPRCDFRWLLSGTPVTNTPADLFTQIEIVAPGERSLGSLETFLAQVDADPAASFAKPVLDRLVLRRTKDQCLDLPDKIFSDVLVDLPPWQRKLYDDMRTQMVCEIQGMSGEQYRAFASTALARLTRLSQLASNPALLLPQSPHDPAKFEVLDGLLEDILSVPDRKVIIWSAYVRNIETLLQRYAHHRAVALYGAIENSDRQVLADRFQTDDDTRVLIANAAAAGTGFTLTAASFTIYESMSWRYDHYAQSQDRNHRIGQSLPVNYLRLIAADTIDEAVAQALERKAGMARNLLSDADVGAALSRLSPEEMCSLIATSRLPE